MTKSVDVLCIGDLDVDLIVSVDRLPGLDDKVSGKQLGLMPGGMSANSAVALARLGKSTALVACVGDDENGRIALASVASEGIDISSVIHRPATATFMCLIMLTPLGEKALIRLETGAYLPRASELRAEMFAPVRHVHLTFGNLDMAERALTLAREQGATTSLDLEAADVAGAAADLARVLALVDLLFVNRAGRHAAERLLGMPLTPGCLRGSGAIIHTLGAQGSRYEGIGICIEAPSLQVRTRDTTGAGDCFAAAFVARHLEGAPPAECLRFANVAAALSTAVVGAHAGMPQRAQVEATLLQAAGEHTS